MQNEELWRRCWLFVFVWVLSGMGDRVLADEMPWAEDALEPEQYESYAEVLQALEDAPVDLNRADASALLSLPWLSEVQVQAILRFRNAHGPFQRIEDLYKVEGMDEELIETLRPYVVFSGPEHRKRERPVIRTRWRFSWPPSSSMASLNTWRIYSKSSILLGPHVHGGWVTERDPGERQWADFWAGYLELQHIGGIDRIVVGDFRPGFGQGVVFNRWSRSRGGWDTVKGRESRSFGYSSTIESGALRGGLVRQRWGALETTVFVSRARWDASLDARGRVKSISYGGQHGTTSEQAKRDALREQLVGGRLYWRTRSWLCVGGTVAQSIFNPAFSENRGERDRFAFSGSRIRWGSVDWDFYLSDLNLFGEMAFSGGRSKGLVIGAVIDRKTLRIKALIRAYSRDFHVFHGSGFSITGSEDGNEVGAFWGIRWNVAEDMDLSMYVDGYRQRWRGYWDVLPTGGTSLGGKWEQRLGRDVQTMVRFRYKDREATEGTYGAYDVISHPRRELRWEGRWRGDRGSQIHGRAEHVWAEHEDGTALFADVRLRPWRGMTWEGRLTFFDVSAYAARIYELEGDLRGALSMQTWTGRGNRWYIIGRQTIGNSILSAKLSRTIHLLPEGERRETGFSVQVDVGSRQ